MIRYDYDVVCSIDNRCAVSVGGEKSFRVCVLLACYLSCGPWYLHVLDPVISSYKGVRGGKSKKKKNLETQDSSFEVSELSESKVGHTRPRFVGHTLRRLFGEKIE